MPAEGTRGPFGRAVDAIAWAVRRAVSGATSFRLRELTPTTYQILGDQYRATRLAAAALARLGGTVTEHAEGWSVSGSLPSGNRVIPIAIRVGLAHTTPTLTIICCEMDSFGPECQAAIAQIVSTMVGRH